MRISISIATNLEQSRVYIAIKHLNNRSVSYIYVSSIITLVISSFFLYITNVIIYIVYFQYCMLVEFKHEISVEEILSQASFMSFESIIPVKSSILWFRKNYKQDSQKKTPMVTDNYDLYPNIQKIIQLLYNSHSVISLIWSTVQTSMRM